MAGFHYKGVEGDVWEFFWQYIESAIAIVVASITASHTLFVKQTNAAKCQKAQLAARFGGSSGVCNYWFEHSPTRNPSPSLTLVRC